MLSMVALVVNSWSDNPSDGIFSSSSLRLLAPLDAAMRTTEDQTNLIGKNMPEQVPEARNHNTITHQNVVRVHPYDPAPLVFSR